MFDNCEHKMICFGIILIRNNSIFNGQHFIQTNAPATGSKNSCSYTDLARTYWKSNLQNIALHFQTVIYLLQVP